MHKEEGEQTSYMIKNGAILLEKLIESSKGKYNSFRSFSAEEVKAATDNFSRLNIRKQDDVYELYQGFLPDRPISVMKYIHNMESTQEYCSGDMDMETTQEYCFDNTITTIEYCFNNITYAAQMCHKNASKLIGCGLETEVPILVFESMKYGSLADRIHCNSQSDFEPLLWTLRLKIAMEIANIVAYLLFGFSRPVVFRDIKSSNILFNESQTVKLFDFSFYASIPEDKTYVEDIPIVGTHGFRAPEYLMSGNYDEKCDGFSFGILLLVLLTGQEPSAVEIQQYDMEGHVLKYMESSGSQSSWNWAVCGERTAIAKFCRSWH